MGRSLKVKPDGHGSFTVDLDGADISRNVSSVDLRVTADGQPPTAVLGITVFEVEAELDARIVLTEGTDALLKQLGWIPPVEEKP